MRPWRGRDQAGRGEQLGKKLPTLHQWNTEEQLQTTHHTDRERNARPARAMHPSLSLFAVASGGGVARERASNSEVGFFLFGAPAPRKMSASLAANEQIDAPASSAPAPTGPLVVDRCVPSHLPQPRLSHP